MKKALTSQQTIALTASTTVNYIHPNQKGHILWTRDSTRLKNKTMNQRLQYVFFLFVAVYASVGFSFFHGISVSKRAMSLVSGEHVHYIQLEQFVFSLEDYTSLLLSHCYDYFKFIPLIRLLRCYDLFILPTTFHALHCHAFLHLFVAHERW